MLRPPPPRPLPPLHPLPPSRRRPTPGVAPTSPRRSPSSSSTTARSLHLPLLPTHRVPPPPPFAFRTSPRAHAAVLPQRAPPPPPLRYEAAYVRAAREFARPRRRRGSPYAGARARPAACAVRVRAPSAPFFAARLRPSTWPPSFRGGHWQASAPGGHVPPPATSPPCAPARGSHRVP